MFNYSQLQPRSAVPVGESGGPWTPPSYETVTTDKSPGALHSTRDKPRWIRLYLSTTNT